MELRDISVIRGSRLLPRFSVALGATGNIGGRRVTFQSGSPPALNSSKPRVKT